MSVKVTVAVPIYNVELYLTQCVDSILAQTYENIEILLVDDGSSDGCGAICDSYAARDSRVHVIHKENGGVSTARNAALDAATGEYVLFVDSDDYLENTAIETMVRYAEQYDADLTAVNMCSFSDETGETLKPKVIPMEGGVKTFDTPDFQRIRSMIGVQLSIFCLANLYRMEPIRRLGLRFESMQKVHSEDQLFNYCYFMAMRSAVFVPESLYHYRVRKVSLSHERKPIALLNRRITLVRCLRQFLTAHAFPRQSGTVYTSLCWNYFIDGCGALGSAERVVEGIYAIEPANRVLFRKMLRHMLCGKAGRKYIRKNKMDAHAALYFRFMILLMLLGKYDRPAETYLSSPTSSSAI